MSNAQETFYRAPPRFRASWRGVHDDQPLLLSRRRISLLYNYRPRQVFNFGILLEAFQSLDSYPLLCPRNHYDMLRDRGRRSTIILRATLRLLMDDKILVTAFQCVPVSGLWNPNIPTKCINGKQFFLGSLIPDISIDVALLSLPVPYIWRLHRTTSQKIALAGTFMLGGL